MPTLGARRHVMPMTKYIMRVNNDSFDYGSCKTNCGCAIDPVKTLVEGYKSFVRDRLEACLQAKWSVGDCVAGCHKDAYNETVSTRRNSHQRRISKVMIARLAKALENAEDFPENPKDFEDIYGWVGKYVESVSRELKDSGIAEANDNGEDEDCFDDDGEETLEDLCSYISPLLKYDTALRLSYNLANPDGNLIPPKDNNCLPKQKVYLQQGALLGARALLQISKLSREEVKLTPNREKHILKNYINPDWVGTLDRPSILDIVKFNNDLKSLGSYHLENFLCVYHRLFEDWATGYEIRLEELKKSKNKNK